MHVVRSYRDPRLHHLDLLQVRTGLVCSFDSAKDARWMLDQLRLKLDFSASSSVGYLIIRYRMISCRSSSFYTRYGPLAVLTYL